MAVAQPLGSTFQTIPLGLNPKGVEKRQSLYDKNGGGAQEKEELNEVVWGYAEQRLASHAHALLQYSINPSADGAEIMPAPDWCYIAVLQN